METCFEIVIRDTIRCLKAVRAVKGREMKGRHDPFAGIIQIKFI